MAISLQEWRNRGRPRSTPKLFMFWSVISGQAMPLAAHGQPIGPGQLRRTARQAWQLTPADVANLARHLGVVEDGEAERRARVVRGVGDDAKGCGRD